MHKRLSEEQLKAIAASIRYRVLWRLYQEETDEERKMQYFWEAFKPLIREAFLKRDPD